MPVVFMIILLMPRIAMGWPQDTLMVIGNEDAELETEQIILTGIETAITITITDSAKARAWEGKLLPLEVNDTMNSYPVLNSQVIVPLTIHEKEELVIRGSEFSFSRVLTPIPLWMSILPPLIAILMALVFREVFSALFIGILVGSTIIYYYQGQAFFTALFSGALAVIDTYIPESLMEHSHVAIIIFSMLIGAMVGLISANGGMKGIVNKLSKYARSASSGQFITWLLGIAIFFDDYANTLVVGNTMRPVTDRLRISREKLSYIVDSTAAPVAAIAFVTTWIGAELSYIQNGIEVLNLDETAYNVFLNSLGYSFYPILTLFFIFLVIRTNRDYGPMYRAELRARKNPVSAPDKDHGDSETAGNIDGRERWYNAAIPVLVVIFGTMAGLIYTGLQARGWSEEVGFSRNLSQVIGHSDSFNALLWASLGGVIVALILTLIQRILSLREAMESLMSGFKTMMTAIVILVLAWSVALITQRLHTADFISGFLTSTRISPYLIPAITFILSALVAFSTGSSWGTMAILYPLILPSSWLISSQSGLDYDQSMAIFYNVVSTVLAGSVLGDHCSPISDTTILSSLASSCDHIEHVRTQLPYALTVGSVAIVTGTIPAAYGVPFYITLPVGAAILFLILRFTGKKVQTFAVSSETEGVSGR